MTGGAPLDINSWGLRVLKWLYGVCGMVDLATAVAIAIYMRNVPDVPVKTANPQTTKNLPAFLFPFLAVLFRFLQSAICARYFDSYMRSCAGSVRWVKWTATFVADPCLYCTILYSVGEGDAYTLTMMFVLVSFMSVLGAAYDYFRTKDPLISALALFLDIYILFSCIGVIADIFRNNQEYYDGESNSVISALVAILIVYQVLLVLGMISSLILKESMPYVKSEYTSLLATCIATECICVIQTVAVLARSEAGDNTP